MSLNGLPAKNQLWAPFGCLAVCNIAVLSLLYYYMRPVYLVTPSRVVLTQHSFTKKLDGASGEGRELTIEKVILLWNMPIRSSYPKILDPTRCENCIITRNRSALAYSDAVVFNFRGIRNPEDLPARSEHKPNQVFVWMCRESPKTTLHSYKYDLKNLTNVFNWTMTYRLDSDVFYPYVEMLHRMHDEKRLYNTSTVNVPADFVDLVYSDVDSLMAKKKYLVAWVVGNCGGTAGAQFRMMIVNKLMRAGLRIDRFGSCFKGRPFPPYRSEEAHQRLAEYKFYLAFENTRGCREYVTYKFWKNAIFSGAVPIVWGSSKEDIARLAPKHSFIHLEDFQTSADLVEYLKYLDLNDTAYREFFAWRESELSSEHTAAGDDWIFSTGEALGFCKLCRMLHADRNRSGVGEMLRRKSIKSLRHWWYGSEKHTCLSST